MSPIVQAVRELGQLWAQHAAHERDWENLLSVGAVDAAERFARKAERIADRVHLLEQHITTLPPTTLVEARLVRALSAVCGVGGRLSDCYRVASAMQALARQAKLLPGIVAAYVLPDVAGIERLAGMISSP